MGPRSPNIWWRCPAARLSGFTTVVVQDGRRNQNFPNGTSLEVSAQGTKKQTNPDGAISETRSDGSKLWTNPDGSSSETFPVRHLTVWCKTYNNWLQEKALYELNLPLGLSPALEDLCWPRIKRIQKTKQSTHYVAADGTDIQESAVLCTWCIDCPV